MIKKVVLPESSWVTVTCRTFRPLSTPAFCEGIEGAKSAGDHRG